MIVRICQGIVLRSNAERYQVLLRENILPRYQRADGNLGVYVCGDTRDQLVNFLVLSVWSSWDALVRFIGQDAEVIAPSGEEKKLLLAFESMARNYEVFQMCKPENEEDVSDDK